MRVRCHTNQTIELASGSTRMAAARARRRRQPGGTTSRILPKAWTTNSALVIGGLCALQGALQGNGRIVGLTLGRLRRHQLPGDRMQDGADGLIQ